VKALKIPFIQEMIKKEEITIEQTSQFNFSQLDALKIPFIQEMLEKEEITMEQTSQFNSSQVKALKIPFIQEMIKKEEITIEQTSQFNSSQLDALKIPFIQKMIKNKKITIEQINQFNSSQLDALKIPFIQKMIKNKKITIEQINQFNSSQAVSALKIPFIQEMLEKEEITIEQTSQFDSYQVDALKIPFIQGMIKNKKITIEQINRFNDYQADALKIPFIQEMLEKEEITMEQTSQFDSYQVDALKIPFIQGMIKNKKITIEQTSQFDSYQVDALKIPFIQGMIKNKKITIEQTSQFNSYQAVSALKIPFIQEMLEKEEITMEQTSQFNSYQLNALEIPFIQGMIKNKKITIEQTSQFNSYQVDALKIPFIQEMLEKEEITIQQTLQVNDFDKLTALKNQSVQILIETGIATFAQALRFSQEALRALNNQETMRRLTNREIHIEYFLNNNILVINSKQSTHTASIHESASLSAKNLYELYGDKITNGKIDGVISNILEYLRTLVETDEISAAKRFIEKIINESSYYGYTDPSSNITVRQLLGLIFLASQDTQNLNSGVQVENALQRFVEAMFEIQRGYNLDDNGQDANSNVPDRNICPAGAFNKLVETLSGIHNKGNLVFITKNTALLKLPIIVNNVVLQYLKEQKRTVNPDTFKELINEIERNGVEPILPNIKTDISDLFFEEFKSLCEDQGQQNHFFLDSIENIIYTDVSKIIGKLKSIMESEKVRDFKSQMEKIEAELQQSTYLDSLASPEEECNVFMQPPPQIMVYQKDMMRTKMGR
jgi:hypothetical protein